MAVCRSGLLRIPRVSRCVRSGLPRGKAYRPGSGLFTICFATTPNALTIITGSAVKTAAKSSKGMGMATGWEALCTEEDVFISGGRSAPRKKNVSIVT